MRQANRAAEALRDELNATKAEARRLQAQLTEVEAETKAEAKRTVTELREELDGAKAEVRRLEQLLSNAQADTDAARAEARRLQAQHAKLEEEAELQAMRTVDALREELDTAKVEAKRMAADLRVELECENAESRRLQARLDEAEDEAVRQATVARNAAAAMQGELEVHLPTQLLTLACGTHARSHACTHSRADRD